MKHFKQFFVFALLALFSVGAWGETIDFTAQGYANQEAVTSVSGTDCTITFDKGTNSNAPKYYTSGTAIRAYGGNTITIASASKTIEGITFTFGSSDGSNAITADEGTFSSPTWSGSASSITFTIGGTSGNRRLASVEVTYASGGTPTPSLSAAPTTIDFGTVEQGASVAAKTVAVTYANLTGSVTYSGLSGAFAATDAISNSGDEITITPSTATIGNYNQTLTIQSTADSKSVDVTVTMNVVEPFEGLVLTFPDEGTGGDNIQSYTASWTATKGTQSWSIYGFNTNKWNGWSVIKTGRKSGTGSVAQPLTATIETQVLDHAVGTVVVTIDAVTAAQVTSHKLYVADNAGYTDAIEVDGDPADIAVGDITYTIPVANRANDLYYKLEYETAGTAGSNGILAISQIAYAYATATPQKQNAGLAYDAADAQKLAKVGGTLTAPTLTNPNSLTITYASSNTDVVEVNASTGAITAIKAAGKAVITASSEEDATYKAGSATYTIFVATEAGTAEDPLTESSAKALIDLGCTLNAHVAGTIKTPAYYSTSQTYTVTLTDDFQFYKLKDLGNQLFTSDYLKANDQLVVLGPLGKHNTTYQLGDGCYIVNYVEYTEPLVDISNTKATAYTVAQALTLAADPTSDLSKAVYIAGVVYDVKNFNSTNGTLDIYIKDAGEENKFEFYKCAGIYDASLTAFTAEDDVQVGDEVIGYGVMKYYSGNGGIWEFDNTKEGDYLVELNRPAVPTYSITYVENGANEDIADEAAATNLPDPLPTVTKDSKAFGGWYTTSTFEPGTEAVAGAALTDDVILYAKWNDISPWASVYTSNVAIASDVVSHVTIAETTYDAVKANKASTATITLPQGVTTIHLHLVAWNGEAQTVSVTGDCFNDAKELTIEANAAVSGSSTTYNLGASGVNYYFSLTPDKAVNADDVITITAASGKRFVLFGVNQEGGVLPVLESIEIGGDLTTKTGYKVGDDLDLDGLTVSAIYSLGGVAQTPVDITDKLGDGLTLTYDPLVENQTEVTITATYEGKTDDIIISGLEVSSADPKIYVDKLSVNFGTVAKDAVVADQTITVTLTNVAAATAVLGGTNPEAFSIDKTALVDGDVITISVASTATYGSYSAKITISDNAAAAEAKTVNLSLAIEDVETPVSTISKWVAAEAADLVDGAEVLITGVKDDVIYAMGMQNSNNRAAVAASVDGKGVLTPGEGTMAFTLVAQGDGTFALRTSNGKYLYAAASGSNHLKTQAEVDVNAKWTLTIASAVAEGSSNRNQMKFNGTSLLFSCYSSGQSAIALYTRAKEEREGFTVGKLATVCVPYAVAQEDIIGADVYEIAGKNEAGKIVFDQVTTGGMEAGVAYLVQAKAETATFYYSGNAVAEPQNEGKALKGTFDEIDITVANAANVYFFKDNALWAAKETGVTIPANRAWLDMSAVGNAGPSPAPGRRRITMDVHGENAATGMDELSASEAPRKMIIDGKMYILRGEKMYNANGTLVK